MEKSHNRIRHSISKQIFRPKMCCDKW